MCSEDYSSVKTIDIELLKNYIVDMRNFLLVIILIFTRFRLHFFALNSELNLSRISVYKFFPYFEEKNCLGNKFRV